MACLFIWPWVVESSSRIGFFTLYAKIENTLIDSLLFFMRNWFDTYKSSRYHSSLIRSFLRGFSGKILSVQLWMNFNFLHISNRVEEGKTLEEIIKRRFQIPFHNWKQPWIWNYANNWHWKFFLARNKFASLTMSKSSLWWTAQLLLATAIQEANTMRFTAEKNRRERGWKPAKSLLEFMNILRREMQVFENTKRKELKLSVVLWITLDWAELFPACRWASVQNSTRISFYSSGRTIRYTQSPEMVL